MSTFFTEADVAELKAALDPRLHDHIDRLLRDNIPGIPGFIIESGGALTLISPKEIVTAFETGRTEELLATAKRLVSLDTIAEKWSGIAIDFEDAKKAHLESTFRETARRGNSTTREGGIG